MKGRLDGLFWLLFFENGYLVNTGSVSLRRDLGLHLGGSLYTLVDSCSGLGRLSYILYFRGRFDWCCRISYVSWYGWLRLLLLHSRLLVHLSLNCWLGDFREKDGQLFEQAGVVRKELGHLILELLLGRGVFVVEIEHRLDILVVLLILRLILHFLIKSLHDICFNFRLGDIITRISITNKYTERNTKLVLQPILWEAQTSWPV